MTSVADSVIFKNILSTAESAAIWSDKTRTSYYLHFEGCLAKAQARLGIIPQEAANHIHQNCDISIIDWDELRQQTERIGYPVLGVVKQLVAKVNGVEAGLGEWAHWGATTQDVTDTATVLQLRDTLQIIDRDIERIIATLKLLCERYKDTPMAARSNLQQAVPITFGFKLARLLATFIRHRTRLVEVRSRLLVFEFSGAAGTLATLSPTGGDIARKCQKEFGREIGLAVPEIAWHTERDRIAEVGQLFSLVTATCAKFALDVKLMMQSEVGEVSEPYAPERGSSSTMPQKRNPISCAYITATSSTVRQLSTSLCEAMVEDHERSTGPWEIEWIVLPDICTLTCSTLWQTTQLLEGLEVHPSRMAQNLKLSRGAIVSEAVMMGLGRDMGRQKAHDLVYNLCYKANYEERPLVDLLDESDEIKVPRQRLEELCDPSNYLGDSIDMVDKVLAIANAS